MNPSIRHLLIALVLLSVLSGAAISSAIAGPDPTIALAPSAPYEKYFEQLTGLFVMAVLLENAFALIFNWRVFLAYFSRTGTKTIVMVVISFLVVYALDVDIVAKLVSAYKGGQSQPSIFLSQCITALILAGGSAGVSNIMRTLGFRSENRDAELNPKAPEDQAWVAVQVTRINAVGNFQVTIKDMGSAAALANAPAPIAGTIRAKRPSLLSLIARGSNRFPQNGGCVLKPNVGYEIKVEGTDAQQKPITAVIATTVVFAPRAVVDFTVSL